ncbi:MAG: DUF58 domain-containing protein [Acidimicrobiia bacterium]
MPSGVALSRRGWTLTGAASGLLLAGRLLGALELTVLGVITLSLLALAWLWVRSRKRLVRVERTIRPTRVHVGGDARVDLEINDSEAGDSPQLLLTDVFDGGRRAARFLVPALRRGQRARAAYRVPTSQRGRYALGPITLTVTDPFGLARRSWTVGTADEVTICPRVHELRPPPGAPGRLRSASPFAVRFHAPAVDGEEFLTLREYEVGDDLRRIHWRSTARTGELVVREDEAQWQPRAVVLLDTRPGAHDVASFEAAVEATASVVARLVRSVLPVEVIATDGRTLGVTGNGRHHGIGVEALIMDELAVVQPAGADSLAPVARRLRAAQRRGLLVAVMGALGQAELDSIAALGAPSAPLVLVTTRSEPGAPSRSTAGVVTVNGAAGAFAPAWDAAMVTRTRGGRAVRR